MTETTTTKKTAAKKAEPAPVPNHRDLATALAAFQGEVPTVHKGKTAKVEKDGRTLYSYAYADLADVADVAYPVLSRHGLSFTTKPIHMEGLGFVLQGILRHCSGERDEGYLPIQGRDAQAIGSSLTYNRRYLLGCMTGIVTDEDDDGSRAAQAKAERPRSDVQAEKPQPPQETPPHLQMTYDIIGSLSEDQKVKLAAWWDTQAGAGALPLRENMAAITPPQAALVEDAVTAILELPQEGQDPQ